MWDVVPDFEGEERPTTCKRFTCRQQIFDRRAFADRDKIFSYLSEQSQEAARRVVGLITGRIEELGATPFRGRKTDRPGIYTVWVAPYPYRVYYRFDEIGILILHIRHTSQQRF
jgi:plasmid stabilization system protein ParE